MEWLVSTSTQKKRTRESSHTPIDQLVRASRIRIQEEIDSLPVLVEKINKLQEQLDQIPDRRSNIRIKKDLQIEKEKVDNYARRIRDGEVLREFENSVAEFVRIYNTKEKSRRTVNSHAVLPGEQMNAFRIESRSKAQVEVIDEYLMSIDGNVPRICVTRNDICPRCDMSAMRIVPAKAIVSCTTCGYSASYLDATTSSVSYGDDIEFANFSYKRINHFSEWLTNIQGTETYEVPTEVLQQVCQELYSQRVEEKDITYKKVREVLKILKLRKQYEHTTQITCRITNRPLPQLSARTQEMCRLMFRACQEPFSRHAASICQGRKNFMSYSFILYQFLYILGESQDILEAFTLLKGRDKRQRMDEVFALIAADLDWDYCPTS